MEIEIDKQVVIAILIKILSNEKILKKVIPNPEARNTVKQSAKGAAIGGTAMFIGGVVAGPIGLVVGGAIGAVCAYKQTKGTFVSLPEAIGELPDDWNDKLVDEIRSMIKKLGIYDLSEFSRLVMERKELKKNVVEKVQLLVSEYEKSLAITD